MHLIRSSFVSLVLLSLFSVAVSFTTYLPAKADEALNISLLYPSVTSYYGPNENDRFIQALQSNTLKHSLKLNSETRLLTFGLTMRIVNYISLAGTNQEVLIEICADSTENVCNSKKLITSKLVAIQFPACNIGSGCGEIQQHIRIELGEVEVQKLLLGRLSSTKTIPLTISVNADRGLTESSYVDNKYYNQDGIQALNMIGVINSNSFDPVDLTGAKATIYYTCEFGQKYLGGSLSTVVINNIAFFEFVPFDGNGYYLGNNNNIQYSNNCRIESNSNISLGDQILATFDAFNSNGGTINCCTAQGRIHFRLITAKIVSIRINTEESIDIGGEPVALPARINTGEVSIQNKTTNNILRAQIKNGIAIFTSLKFPELSAEPPLKLLRTNAISTANIERSNSYINIYYAWPYKVDDRVITPDPTENWIDQSSGRNIRLGRQRLELDSKCLEINRISKTKANICPVELKEQRSYLETSQNIVSATQYINTLVSSLLNLRYPLSVDKLGSIKIFPSHNEGGFLFNGQIYANSRIEDFIGNVGYVNDPTFNVKDVILHEVIHHLDHQKLAETNKMISHNDKSFAQSIKSQLSNETGRNIWDLSLDFGATYASGNIAANLYAEVNSLHEALASELTALCGNGNKYRQMLNNLEKSYTAKYGQITNRAQYSQMKNVAINRVTGASSGKIINSWYKYCWENDTLSTKTP